MQPHLQAARPEAPRLFGTRPSQRAARIFELPRHLSAELQQRGPDVGGGGDREPHDVAVAVETDDVNVAGSDAQGAGLCGAERGKHRVREELVAVVPRIRRCRGGGGGERGISRGRRSGGPLMYGYFSAGDVVDGLLHRLQPLQQPLLPRRQFGRCAGAGANGHRRRRHVGAVGTGGAAERRGTEATPSRRRRQRRLHTLVSLVVPACGGLLEQAQDLLTAEGRPAGRGCRPQAQPPVEARGAARRWRRRRRRRDKGAPSSNPPLVHTLGHIQEQEYSGDDGPSPSLL
mmetsp:Transcript_77288/g.250153  ORF Transcript_77288/g.250153 Transcript_77288/m.250153 type:complete len:288 (+) Transcript_77288:2856-3719(+)